MTPRDLDSGRLAKIIKDAVLNAKITGKPELELSGSAFTAKFLESWYYRHNKPVGDAIPSTGSFFFLFWKNASVTNMQYAELSALLQAYCTDLAGNGTDIQFQTTEGHRRTLTELFDAYTVGRELPAPDNTIQFDEFAESVAKAIVRDHRGILEHTLLVDLQFTSASVHVPPAIKVDLREIVARSGYIQSAGGLIYVRLLGKVRTVEIEEALKRAVEKNDRCQFIPYADEFFAPHESEIQSIRNGLDGVRIRAGKHRFDDLSLEELLQWVQERFPNIQTPSGTSDFREERTAALKNGASPDHTFWLITDHSVRQTVDDRVPLQGNKIYAIIYKQFLYNGNPLSIFKERKPGWSESITLPHTLSRAMLNVARPLLRTATPSILDPFMGSGTTLFDALLLYPKASATGYDREKSSSRIIEDNLEFFALPLKALLALKARVEALVAALEAEPIVHDASHRDGDRGLLLDVIEQLIGSKAESYSISRLEGGLDDSSLNWLDRHRKIGDRILYYLVWRALKLGSYKISKSPVKNTQIAIIDELTRFCGEIGHLARDRKGKLGGDGDRFTMHRALYSQATLHSEEHFQQLKNDLVVGRLSVNIVRDSVEAMKSLEQTFDLIVTDPPYGFNTTENGESMSALYAQLFDECIRVLKPGGQLIVCLPTNSKTGRYIPIYQTKYVVVPHIISAAYRHKKQLIRPISSRLKYGTLVDPPYYWGGTSAVGRDVLHFVVDNLMEANNGIH